MTSTNIRAHFPFKKAVVDPIRARRFISRPILRGNSGSVHPTRGEK